MITKDDEATQYNAPDSDETKIENTSSGQNVKPEATEKKPEKKPEPEKKKPAEAGKKAEAKGKSGKADKWKRVAKGAGTGILIGGISTVFMSMGKADGSASGQVSGGEHGNSASGNGSNPEWVDDQVEVATSVNDDMSFGEAFAAARAEVGPGGVFEWHGEVYGTYTAEEWNNMSEGERAEYSEHFNWEKIDHSSSDVAQNSTEVNQEAAGNASQHQATTEATVEATAQNVEANEAQTQPGEATAQVADDEIEIVSVNHEEGNDLAQNQPETTDDSSQLVAEVEVQAAEPEIEIIGVTHDSEYNFNVGEMTVNGESVVLFDVDNDLTFDYMAADANGNGQLDEGEMVDIQAQNITVNDLGGFSASPDGDLYASNDGNDIANDAIYEG